MCNCVHSGLSHLHMHGMVRCGNREAHPPLCEPCMLWGRCHWTMMTQCVCIQIQIQALMTFRKATRSSSATTSKPAKTIVKKKEALIVEFSWSTTNVYLWHISCRHAHRLMEESALQEITKPSKVPSCMEAQHRSCQRKQHMATSFCDNAQPRKYSRRFAESLVQCWIQGCSTNRSAIWSHTNRCIFFPSVWVHVFSLYWMCPGNVHGLC